MSSEESQTMFACDKCDKKYASKDTLSVHKQKHTEPCQCPVCGKACSNRSMLARHKQTHSGPCQCPVCGKTCSSRKQLASHKSKAHSDREHKCSECDKSFRLRDSLTRHMKAHSGREYKCELCEKTFACADSLRHHAILHSDSLTKVQCEQCSRAFARVPDLRKHVKTVHADIAYDCDPECGLQSANRAKYAKHLKARHAETHPATCKCAQLDPIITNANTNKMGHSVFAKDERAMKCTDGDCDFSTTCARRMEAHKEESHKEHYKPTLKCASCQNWYNNNLAMESHIARDHRGERQFQCGRENCNFMTTTKFKLSIHTKSCLNGRAKGNTMRKKVPLANDKLIVNKESPRDVYKFGRMIGSGGFGKVFEAVKKNGDPSEKFAIKEVSQAGSKLALGEAARMARHDHKNLMALIEFYQWKQGGLTRCFLVMHLCRPGSLTAMQKDVIFEEVHALYVMKEITAGLVVAPCDFGKLYKVESETFAPTLLARVERERKMELSQEFKDVVTACLSTQTARPTAKKVLDMPVIKNAPFEPFEALVALCIKNQEDRWNGIHGREGAPPTPSTLFPTHKQRVGQSSSGGQSTSPSMSFTAFLERKKRDKRDDSSTFATPSTPFPTRKRKTAQSTSPSSASATASTVFPAHKRKRGETSSASATSSDD